MSAILIQCPQTLKAVPVGLETDHRSFRTLPDIQSTMRCPDCGDVHLWSRNSAVLFGEYPPLRLPQVPIVRQGLHNLIGRRPERRWAA